MQRRVGVVLKQPSINRLMEYWTLFLLGNQVCFSTDTFYHHKISSYTLHVLVFIVRKFGNNIYQRKYVTRFFCTKYNMTLLVSQVQSTKNQIFICIYVYKCTFEYLFIYDCIHYSLIFRRICKSCSFMLGFYVTVLGIHCVG